MLTHSFPVHPFSAPENRESCGFLMFSEGRERMYWERWVKNAFVCLDESIMLLEVL